MVFFFTIYFFFRLSVIFRRLLLFQGLHLPRSMIHTTAAMMRLPYKIINSGTVNRIGEKVSRLLKNKDNKKKKKKNSELYSYFFEKDFLSAFFWTRWPNDTRKFKLIFLLCLTWYYVESFIYVGALVPELLFHKWCKLLDIPILGLICE